MGILKHGSYRTPLLIRKQSKPNKQCAIACPCEYALLVSLQHTKEDGQVCDRPLRFSPSERMERGLFALSVYFYDLAKMKDRNPKA